MAYRRQVFILKASEFLGIKDSNIIILNMEKGIFNTTIEYCKENGYDLKWSCTEFVKKYATIARRILANISYTPNAENFKKTLLEGSVEPYKIAKFTREEFNPEVWKRLREICIDKHTIKEEKVEEGMFTCNRCKSKKTTYYQMQIRSADEPMTTFVTCTNCNLRWKC